MGVIVETLSPQAALEEIERKKLSFVSLHFREPAFKHVSSYLIYINEIFQAYPRVAILHREFRLACKKWAAFSNFNSSIVSAFSSLTQATVNQLFLGEGLCTAVAIQHFTQFFKTHSLLESVSLPIVDEPLHESGLFFYPIKPLNGDFEKYSGHLRFIQAAYRVAQLGKMDSSFEYVPEKILSQQHLQLVRRLPALNDADSNAFRMQDLLKTLSDLASPDSENTGYLLGLGGPQNHAIALHLQSPYHFFDPEYGLAVSASVEELLLYLANHLTQRYPEHTAFALLEFRSATKVDG